LFFRSFIYKFFKYTAIEDLSTMVSFVALFYIGATVLLQAKAKKPLQVFVKILIYTLWYSIVYLAVSALQLPATAIVSFFLAMLVIVPNRGKLTAIIKKFVEKSLYRSVYDVNKMTQEYRQQLNSSLEFDSSIEATRDYLNNLVQEENYAFFLYSDAVFEQVAGQGFLAEAPLKIDFPIHDATIQLFQEAPDYYLIADLNRECIPLKPLLRNLPNYHFTHFVPLHGSSTIIGFLLFTDSIRRHISVHDIYILLRQIFKKAALSIEHTLVHREIKRNSLENKLLLDIVRKISATLSLNSVLNNIINNVSRLVSCNAAAVFLLDQDSDILRHTATRGYDDTVIERVAIKLNEGLSGKAIREKRGFIVPDVKNDPFYYMTRPDTLSQLTVPILVQDEAIGAVILESDQLQFFTNNHLRLLTLFSGLAAVAIRNAQLYEDSQLKQKMETDLLVASKVQKALLPARVPSIKGLKVHAFSIPHSIVGGDIYDVFRMSEHKQAVAIGDISGKGAPAAILMAVAYAGFKSLLKENNTVATVVARLNNFMVEATSSSYYLTFFYGVLNMHKKVFTYCNAGHNPPMIMRSDKSIEYLEDGGIVLGFLCDQVYRQTQLPVESGDYLILFTDGVTEIMNEAGDEFGEDRLEKSLQKNYGMRPRDLRRRIVSDIKGFAGRKEFQDDFTMLIIYVD